MNFLELKSKSFYLPTLFFLGFVLIFIFLFQIGENKYYTLDRTLIQWDGQHYLSIAGEGYEKYPCQYNTHYICGNVGWFPMYPLTGRLLSWLPIKITWLMIGLSWLFFWAALLLLYKLVSEKYSERSAIASITTLLVFPSSFYFLTVFPYSLYLLLAVSIFYCFEKRCFKTMIFLSGLLAVTYPTGLVIGLPLLYYLVKKRKSLKKVQSIQIGLSIVSIGAALLIYCFYNLIRFDDFFLYFTFQSQSYYAHEATFPLLTIYNSLSAVSFSDPVWIMLVLVVILLVVYYRKNFDAGMYLYIIGILLFTPTAGTTDCYYRHIVVAFPLFILIGQSVEDGKRRYLLIPYIIVSLVLMYTVYLPLYKTGQLM